MKLVFLILFEIVLLALQACVSSNAIILDTFTQRFENRVITLQTNEIVFHPNNFVGFCGSFTNAIGGHSRVTIDSAYFTTSSGFRAIRFSKDELLKLSPTINIELMDRNRFHAFPGDKNHIEQYYLDSFTLLGRSVKEFEMYFKYPDEPISWPADSVMSVIIVGSINHEGDLYQIPEIKWRRLIGPKVQMPVYKLP